MIQSGWKKEFSFHLLLKYTPPPPCFLFNYRFLLSVHLIIGSISLDHPQSGEFKTVEPDPTMEEPLQGMGMENGIGSALRSARMKRERRNIVEETKGRIKGGHSIKHGRQLSNSKLVHASTRVDQVISLVMAALSLRCYKNNK